MDCGTKVPQSTSKNLFLPSRSGPIKVTLSNYPPILSEKYNMQINPINWRYSGKPDFLLGTGASPAEKALGWAASFVGVGIYGYLYLTHQLNWAVWQYFLASLLAFDVIGGVVANTLNSCKRFYHTPVKADEPRGTALFKNHLAFSALHIHTLLVQLLYGAETVYYGLFWYIGLVISAWAILKTPLYLRRPAAFLVIVLALLLNLYVVMPVRGFEWLVPALYIKIIYGHLVQEEPYRPASEIEQA